MKKARRGPRDGYDFGQKRQYRRSVWKTFREHASRNGGPSDKHALLLPTSEASEIDVALANGFSEYNLHVVDRNPAIIAHVRRRYKRVNTYGCSVGQVGERLVKEGAQLSYANLDLCSQVSGVLCDELEAFTRSGCLLPYSLVAVTTLRGRERRDFTDSIRHAMNIDAAASFVHNETHPSVRELGPNDHQRLMMIQANLSAGGENGTHIVRAHTYRSTAGNQTMLWAVYGVICIDLAVAAGLPLKHTRIVHPVRDKDIHLGGAEILFHHD